MPLDGAEDPINTMLFWIKTSEVPLMPCSATTSHTTLRSTMFADPFPYVGLTQMPAPSVACMTLSRTLLA